MTARTTERPMTSAERESMRRMRQNSATPVRRWKQGIENALVTCAALMLALTLAWQRFAWIGRHAFDREVGWGSPSAIWIVGIAAAQGERKCRREVRRVRTTRRVAARNAQSRRAPGWVMVRFSGRYGRGWLSADSFGAGNEIGGYNRQDSSMIPAAEDSGEKQDLG